MLGDGAARIGDRADGRCTRRYGLPQIGQGAKPPMRQAVAGMLQCTVERGGRALRPIAIHCSAKAWAPRRVFPAQSRASFLNSELLPANLGGNRIGNHNSAKIASNISEPSAKNLVLQNEFDSVDSVVADDIRFKLRWGTSDVACLTLAHDQPDGRRTARVMITSFG